MNARAAVRTEVLLTRFGTALWLLQAGYAKCGAAFCSKGYGQAPRRVKLK